MCHWRPPEPVPILNLPDRFSVELSGYLLLHCRYGSRCVERLPDQGHRAAQDPPNA